MKRRTTNFVTYDNDVEDLDGHMEIVVKTVSGDQNIAGVIDIYVREER